jgi:hypothetical protein
VSVRVAEPPVSPAKMLCCIPFRDLASILCFLWIVPVSPALPAFGAVGGGAGGGGGGGGLGDEPIMFTNTLFKFF